MFRFEHTEYLWALLLLLPMAAFYLAAARWSRKKMSETGTPGLLQQLMPLRSPKKLFWKFFLQLLAFAFIVLGLANPQLGSKTEKVKRKGIDVMIALDVSNSMLAEDVTPNRLLRAKNFISNFVEQLHNDRIGFIVFAGRAYLQMPLSVDYSAVKLYLKGINSGMVPTQGTAIGEAVGLARTSFEDKEQKHKALIVITDGEDNEGGAEEQIAAAAAEGIKVFTIGVGSVKGSPIPVYRNGIAADYKRDEQGNIVMSKLNEEALSGYAAAGNGKYFLLGSGKDEINAIFKELGRISTKEFEEVVFTDFDDQFQWCLGIAALLLLLDFFITERKWKWSWNI